MVGPSSAQTVMDLPEAHDEGEAGDPAARVARRPKITADMHARVARLRHRGYRTGQIAASLGISVWQVLAARAKDRKEGRG
jgi:DNA-binding CsgD family transcriptional regulator